MNTSLHSENIPNGSIQTTISKLQLIVVIKEDNLTSMHWPIALTIETNAGTDGLICVVTLKTKDGTYKRPVAKVALLLLCEK